MARIYSAKFAIIKKLVGLGRNSTSKLTIPPMLDVPGMKLRIMQSEVKVGLFKQFMASGYKITGHNAGSLKAFLKASPDECNMKFLNLDDGKAFAKWLTDQTGIKFRIPTNTEWLHAVQALGHHLSGNHMEWTEGIATNKTSHILRYLYNLGRSEAHPPETRNEDFALRLVADID